MTSLYDIHNGKLFASGILVIFMFFVSYSSLISSFSLSTALFVSNIISVNFDEMEKSLQDFVPFFKVQIQSSYMLPVKYYEV